MPSWPVLLAWAALLGSVLLAVWLGWRRPPVATLTREVASHAFAGQRLPLVSRLILHARLPTRIEVTDAAPLRVVPDRLLMLGGLVLGEVAAEQASLLSLNARGQYVWPAATLRWADPLGLYWRSRPLPAPATLEVWPGQHPLVLPGLLRPLLSDGELTRQLGLDDPVSLRGVRAYTPGDPPGRVHWRATARTGVLSVRELERSASGQLHLHLDGRGGPVYLESAVRLLSSLLTEALELDLPVSLSTSRGRSPQGRGPEALRRALSLLATAQPDEFAEVLAGLPEPASGSNVILLTHVAQVGVVDAALRLRARASRVVIVALPEGYYLEPGEHPRRQWVGLPDSLRELGGKAAALAGAGVGVRVLRGDMSVLELGR
jgi:uncharacterized protein (DUF58 family)